MAEWVGSPLFGVFLSAFAFTAGSKLSKRIKSPLANPLLIAVAFIIIILKVFHIPLESFQKGGDTISMFLAPATVALALSIYRQIKVLKRYFWPVILGCLAGSATSMASAWGLCRLFGLDEKLTASMLPKSVTTPIAMEISERMGGIIPVTVAAVLITGIIGAVAAPYFIKLSGIKDPVAIGVAIGASSHAIGTSKAVELGEIQGAMSGVAISVSGIITVLLSLFL